MTEPPTIRVPIMFCHEGPPQGLHLHRRVKSVRYEDRFAVSSHRIILSGGLNWLGVAERVTFAHLERTYWLRYASIAHRAAAGTGYSIYRTGKLRP